MVEPLSVLAAIKVCSSAVKQVKNLVEQGAEIHQCAQHIGKFFAAKQDIEKPKHKPKIRQYGKSITTRVRTS